MSLYAISVCFVSGFALTVHSCWTI